MVKITNMLREIKQEKTYALEDAEIPSFIAIVEEMIQLEGGIESIGISIPGKAKEEVVVVSSYDKLNGWKLKKEIQKKWDIAVHVENDANLATIGYSMTNNIPQSECVVGIYYPEKVFLVQVFFPIMSGLQWLVMSTIVFIDESSYSLIFCE